QRKSARPPRMSRRARSSLSLPPPLFRQIELPLSFAETFPISLVIFMQAAMAAYALFIFGTTGILGCKRSPAGMAQAVSALLKPMFQADAAIEYEAFTLPEAVLFGDIFQIFQNTALKMKNLFYTLRQQVIRRFLAADSTGAEHGDALARKAMRVLLPPFRKFAEGFRRRIGGAGEC